MGKISREKFIRLGTALGVGAASASVAACGGGSGGSGGDSGNANAGGNAAASSPSGGASSPDGSGGETNASGGSAGGNSAAIAQTSDISPGSAVTFQDGGEDAVLVHLDNGDFVAYSAICTHAGCTVAYRDGQLACPCHGSIFDPANGAEVVSGPAQTPLQEIPVSVEGGSVVKS